MASTDFFVAPWFCLMTPVGGGDLSGVVGVGEAFLHRGEQFIGVLTWMAPLAERRGHRRSA